MSEKSIDHLMDNLYFTPRFSFMNFHPNLKIKNNYYIQNLR